MVAAGLPGQPHPACSGQCLCASAAACMALLLLLVLQAPCMVLGKQRLPPVVKGPIVVNELLVSAVEKTKGAPRASSWGAIANSTDWFELLNAGSAEVDLSGWTVSRGPAGSDASDVTGSSSAVVRATDGPDGWKVPAGVRLPPGAFLVVLCPKASEDLPAVPAGSNLLVARGVKVKRDGIFLYDAQGNLAASTGTQLPASRPGVTFGLPQPPSNNSALPGSTPYTYLARPTPWLPNSGPLPGAGPFFQSLKSDPDSPTPAGQDIEVIAKLTPNLAPISGATLLYRVNFAPEQQLIMKTTGQSDDEGRVAFTATIPAAQFKAGDMVRWRAQATDASGGVSVDPPGLKQGSDKYRGTVIPVPAEASSPIPVLYWYTQAPAAATTTAGSSSSLYFNGSFYDNVQASKRGVTSLSWAKPKMAFKVPEGFTIRPDIPDVNKLKLNSYYVELGEVSFMKEVVAYQVLADEGVIAPLSFHIQLYLNGQFYGLYGMIEKVDTNLLEHFHLPKQGPLFKSLSGELSNLRWDLPTSEMPSYYKKMNRKSNTQDWQLLANFTRGLAGGGPGSRTSFLFDSLNIPAVVNEAAVQTLLANMDRCTKNFYVYFNPETAEWIRIPWDVEASLGQDNTLGGAPGDLWCILACEQWNSPLYCDSEHPQDISGINTVWGSGLTAVGLNTYQGSATGRRSLAQAVAPGRLPAEGNKLLTFAKPDDWSNPDRVQYGTRSVIGAPGTYNHLTDAILDVTATRAMYMRRLRSLADKYYGQGRLRQIVDALYAKIKPVAALDNTVWHKGDGSRGYTQITTEFIPIRGKQLLQTYAAGGANPLLPGQQVSSSSVVMGLGPSDFSSPKWQIYMSLQLRSPSSSGDSVDVSGWKLSRQGGPTFTFPPGTVFLKDTTVHLSEDVKGFRGRGSSPKAGEAAFVLQVLQGLLPDGGSSTWTLVDDQGAPVRLEV